MTTIPQNCDRWSYGRGYTMCYTIYDKGGFGFRARRDRGGNWTATAAHSDKHNDRRVFRSATLKGLCATIGATEYRRG